MITQTAEGGGKLAALLHYGGLMKTLSIDIESFSSVDLTKAGVYRYAEAEDFEVLLFGYSVDGGGVQVISLADGESIPSNVIDALTDDDVQK